MKCFYVPGTCTIIACGTDGTKLLVESVCETVLQSLFLASTVYQDSSMHYDWPAKSAIVDLLIRLKEI